MRACAWLALLLHVFLRVFLHVFLSGLLRAQSATVVKRMPVSGEVQGAALSPDGRLFTWGDGLRVWEVPALRSRTLADAGFGKGGCLTDLDNDGHSEFVGKEGTGLGKLTWRRPPDWQPVVIDDEFDTHDCMEATLFGRKGVLVIQRYMQVRFYELASSSPWPFREIYSIYTPSRQTGLSLRDIDGDGLPDIVCGNYWIQSPSRFDLPWHIFAINTWFEDPGSAMLAHVSRNGDLVMAQAHLPEARAAVFRKPEDPRKLWVEHRLEESLHRVHAVAAIEDEVFIGENNGTASRLFALRGNRLEKIAEGIDSLGILLTEAGVVSVGPKEIVLWRYRRK